MATNAAVDDAETSSALYWIIGGGIIIAFAVVFALSYRYMKKGQTSKADSDTGPQAFERPTEFSITQDINPQLAGFLTQSNPDEVNHSIGDGLGHGNQNNLEEGLVGYEPPSY